jgi:hypothetical protein
VRLDIIAVLGDAIESCAILAAIVQAR